MRVAIFILDKIHPYLQIPSLYIDCIGPLRGFLFKYSLLPVEANLAQAHGHTGAERNFHSNI